MTTRSRATTRTSFSTTDRPATPVSLVLSIGNQVYFLAAMPLAESAEAMSQWSLAKPGGDRYVVTMGLDGIPVCTCADWTFRREQIDHLGCKHIRSLRAFGLLGLSWTGEPEVEMRDH
jgi:hypothetical protein